MCTYMIYLYLVLLALVSQQDPIPPAPAFGALEVVLLKFEPLEFLQREFLPGKAVEKRAIGELLEYMDFKLF